MVELGILLSNYSLEPWNRFTAGLVAGMTTARLLDFLSTWVVTPRLALEAYPLMGRMGWAPGGVGGPFAPLLFSRRLGVRVRVGGQCCGLMAAR